MSFSFFDREYKGIVNLSEFLQNSLDENNPEQLSSAVQIVIDELKRIEGERQSAIKDAQDLSALMRNYNLDEGSYQQNLEKLQQVLDSLVNKMEDGDKKLSETRCKSVYKSFWKKLSNNSRKFLITADFLHTKLSQMELDFAPAIVEMCRAFENEIKSKIFSGFIADIATTNRSYTPDKLLDQAKKVYSEQGKIVLSLSQMINEFAKLRNADSASYQAALKKYASNDGWDVVSLSTNPFISESNGYVDKFRNDAAHTTPFVEAESEKCLVYTEKRIRQFLSLNLRLR